MNFDKYILILFFFLLFMLFMPVRSMEIDRDNSSSSDSETSTKSDKELKVFRTFLCEYTIKEIMERHHYEQKGRVSQQRQKWLSMGVGAITTLIPLIVALITIFNREECPELSTFNSTK